MIRRRRKLAVPGLNATSTADISFILLVFFLVISSMDSNKGLQRQLAPQQKERDEQITEIDARNVLDIAIGADGGITVDKHLTDIKQLAARISHFVENSPRRSAHMINVTMFPDSRYDDYFHVQDAISTAYLSLRQKYAVKRFRKSYADCNDDERKAVDKEFPQRVTESVETKEDKGND